MTECILKVTAISMAGYCIRAIMVMDGLYTSNWCSSWNASYIAIALYRELAIQLVSCDHVMKSLISM